jgi:hypothetical protein
MKSNTRTVLNETLTSATSYSSGPLDVGDLFELTIDFNVTNVTYDAENYGPPSASVSRIGSDGELYPLGTISFSNANKYSFDIGASLSNTSTGSLAVINRFFGDQVQLDFTFSPDASISTTISIKGKG